MSDSSDISPVLLWLLLLKPALVKTCEYDLNTMVLVFVFEFENYGECCFPIVKGDVIHRYY